MNKLKFLLKKSRTFYSTAVRVAMASNIPVDSDYQQLMRTLVQQMIKEKKEKYGNISMSEEMERLVKEEIKAEIISGQAVLKVK